MRTVRIPSVWVVATGVAWRVDDDSTYGSQEDVSSSRPNSILFRRPRPGSNESLSSISSKESSSEERDSSAPKPTSLLKRTYSLRSDPENNPLRENTTVRLLISFVMLMFNLFIQMLAMIWDTTRSLLFEEDTPLNTSSDASARPGVHQHQRKLVRIQESDSPPTPTLHL